LTIVSIDKENNGGGVLAPSARSMLNPEEVSLASEREGSVYIQKPYFWNNNNSNEIITPFFFFFFFPTQTSTSFKFKVNLPNQFEFKNNVFYWFFKAIEFLFYFLLKYSLFIQ
jgi:hypothetical protein